MLLICSTPLQWLPISFRVKARVPKMVGPALYHLPSHGLSRFCYSSPWSLCHADLIPLRHWTPSRIRTFSLAVTSSWKVFLPLSGVCSATPSQQRLFKMQPHLHPERLISILLVFPLECKLHKGRHLSFVCCLTST